MIQCSCQKCGRSFETYPAWVRKGRGKFCSKECAYAARKGRTGYERSPEHRELMRQRMLDLGHKPSEEAIEAAADARRGVAPSEKARDASAERWTGTGNPRWKDGRAYERYGPGYGRGVRARVIERDKVCQDCGLWDERPKGMHIHHIDGGKTNHALDNLVLLCFACHQRRHAKYRT